MNAKAYFWLSGASGPAVSSAPALHTREKTFRLADDSIWPWRMVTDFAILQRFLNGDGLDEIYAQRQAAGANGLRILGMKSGSLFELDPTRADYFDGVDRLFQELGARGFHAEFVVFADAQLCMPDVTKQKRHFGTVCEIAKRHRHIVLELVNEFEKNGVAPENFSRPADLVCSHGSGLSDAMPALPAWTHLTYHPARDDEWPRKFKSALELQDSSGVGCVENEPIRCDAGDGTPVEDWFDAGACAQLLTPGATFHSDKGRFSTLWTDDENVRAKAFFDGMAAMPVEAQTGIYAVAIPGGRGLQNFDELRTYGMVLNTEQWAVVIRPGPTYPRHGQKVAPATINGWSIVEQRGDRGTVVKLRR